MTRNLAIALAALALAEIDPSTVASEGGSYDDLARSCTIVAPAFGNLGERCQNAVLREAVAHIEALEAIEPAHVIEYAGCGYATREDMVSALVEGFVGAEGANDVFSVLSDSSDFDLLREMAEELWVENGAGTAPRCVTAHEALTALTELRDRFAVDVPDFTDDEFAGEMAIDLYLRGTVDDGDLEIDYLRHTGGSWLADDDAICLDRVRPNIDGVEFAAWLRDPAQQRALWRIANGVESTTHDGGFLADTGCRVRLDIEAYMEALSGHDDDAMDQLALVVIAAEELTEEEWGDFDLWEDDDDYKPGFEMSRDVAVRFLEIRWHQAGEISESSIRLGLALIAAGELTEVDFVTHLTALS